MVKSVKEILSDDFWIMPATPEYKAEGIPYITSKNIKNGSIDFRNVNYISEEDYESISKNRPIKIGDILISMIGTLGETAEVTEHDGKFYGQNMFLVRLNNKAVNKRYFLNFFQSGAVKRALAGSQNQSTQKYLKANHIEDLQIPVPSIEEQSAIANKLDLLSLVIAQRKRQLDTLDELIKARFVELFGNPKINEKKFTKAPMGDYMTLLTDFSSNGSYKTLDSGVTMYDEPDYAWMVRTTDLESGDMSSIKYIDEKAYELLSKSKIYGGEIIMSKIGSAGKVYLMPDIDMPASLGRNAFMFRYDERINVRFLFEQLVSEYGQAEIQQYVRGAVTKTITKDDVRSVLIIVPEKELQDEYVEFVKQVDKSKVVVQKALNETQTLFDSLMQEYFG